MPDLLLERPRQIRWSSRIVAGCVWAYLVMILAVWGLLYFGGDRWWFATLMLFGPRWPYMLPLVVLVPAAALRRPRSLWVLALTAVCLLGPILGLCVPWRTVFAKVQPNVRLLICNLAGPHVDTEVFWDLIEETRPDVVVLQECKQETELPWPSNWHLQRLGQMLVASRWPIQPFTPHVNHHPPSRWPPLNAVYCIIDRPQGPFGLVDVHLGSPRYALQAVLDRRTLVNGQRSHLLNDNIVYRRRESETTSQWIAGLTDQPLMIAGDFNMPADSPIFRRYWGKYANAFSTTGFGFGHTKHSSVAGWSYGARIDHILTGPGFRAIRCWVGPNVGSDHLPVLADIGLEPQSERSE